MLWGRTGREESLIGNAQGKNYDGEGEKKAEWSEEEEIRMLFSFRVVVILSLRLFPFVPFPTTQKAGNRGHFARQIRKEREREGRGERFCFHFSPQNKTTAGLFSGKRRRRREEEGVN